MSALTTDNVPAAANQNLMAALTHKTPPIQSTANRENDKKTNSVAIESLKKAIAAYADILVKPGQENEKKDAKTVITGVLKESRITWDEIQSLLVSYRVDHPIRTKIHQLFYNFVRQSPSPAAAGSDRGDRKDAVFKRTIKEKFKLNEWESKLYFHTASFGVITGAEATDYLMKSNFGSGAWLLRLSENFDPHLRISFLMEDKDKKLTFNDRFIKPISDEEILIYSHKNIIGDTPVFEKTITVKDGDFIAALSTNFKGKMVHPSKSRKEGIAMRKKADERLEKELQESKQKSNNLSSDISAYPIWDESVMHLNLDDSEAEGMLKSSKNRLPWLIRVSKADVVIVSSMDPSGAFRHVKIDSFKEKLDDLKKEYGAKGLILKYI